MKKNILILLFLFIPSVSNAWLCLLSSHYKIVDYPTSPNELTIKWLWFNDIFLNWPIFETKNTIFKGSHYLKTWFEACKYEGFEKLEKLKFTDLLFKDKMILIWNFISTILIFILIFWLIFYRPIKRKILKSKNK